MSGRTRIGFIWKKFDVVARQFVSACRLGFKLPSIGEKVEFTAPLPGDLEEALEWVGWV